MPQINSLIVDPPVVANNAATESAALATVRRAQLTAFWNAPRSAHTFTLLVAIERGWRELWSEQCPPTSAT